MVNRAVIVIEEDKDGRVHLELNPGKKGGKAGFVADFMIKQWQELVGEELDFLKKAR